MLYIQHKSISWCACIHTAYQYFMMCVYSVCYTYSIIIIFKQLVTQLMSVKNKLMNRSCWLATAVSDGKICKRDVFLSREEKRQDMRGHRLNGVADHSRRQAQYCGKHDWRTLSYGYWGRDDFSCHSSVAVLLERRAEAGQTGGLACLLSELWTSVMHLCTQSLSYFEPVELSEMCSDRLVPVTMRAIVC